MLLMQAKNFVIRCIIQKHSAKIDEYFLIGVNWVGGRSVERDPLIYLFLEKVQMFTKTNTIIGKDILSGFELKISR